jgi:hypothetical protein
MRINNSGHYEYCRWANKENRVAHSNLKTETPIKFFQNGMSEFRASLLNGEQPTTCKECYTQDTHKKVSGRQRQLLKVGVQVDRFVQTMLSSPWLGEFEHSKLHNGDTTQLPQDWQIDLGNFCNSGCVFCNPFSSSWIAAEYKRIGLIEKIPKGFWAEDPDQLATFVDAIKQSKRLAYLHFIGGETLITPAFKVILTELIKQNLHTELTIGFTTNLTVWRQDIVDLLVQFKSVNFGASVECFHSLNDYLRYQSNIETVEKLLEQWLEVANEHNWIKSLRITPTLFSVWHLDTVYEYARRHQMIVESCNFLEDPTFMRPSVLPGSYRQQVIAKLQTWINSSVGSTDNKIINVRNMNLFEDQLVQDASSYINYLTDHEYETHRLPDLVQFLKTIEQSRGNKILDYIPEYEELLRSAGY